jgi:hypothetical protein
LELEDIADKDHNLETFIDYLRDNDLPYIYNHPFWHEHYETPNLPAIFEIAELFPVIEYNMGRVNVLNYQAMKLAECHGAAVAAGTDTHIGAVGRAFTLAKGETFREFFNEITSGRSYILPRDVTVNRMTHEINQRMLNLFAKEKWLFDKPSFHINTGVEAVDDLIEKLAKAEPNHHRQLRKIVRTLLQLINQSRIPASLYINSQKALGEKVEELTWEYAPIPTPKFRTRWAH